MRRLGIFMWIMAAVTFASLPLLVGIKAQDILPPIDNAVLIEAASVVEGKKNRDRNHRHDEPVTPAPLVIPEPDPAFPDVEIERRPKRPDNAEPERRPVAPDAKPVVIYRGGWSSWFGGLFCGLTVGIVGSWLASLANVGAWIRRVLGK